MFLLLGVVVAMRVEISLLGSHSGPTRAVCGGVNALLEADALSARIKAAGQGSSARWWVASESARQSPTAPARLQATPIT